MIHTPIKPNKEPTIIIFCVFSEKCEVEYPTKIKRSKATTATIAATPVDAIGMH